MILTCFAHPAAQDWLPTEAKQGWAGQYLDGRPPEKTRLLLEEVLVRPAGVLGLCDGDTILSKKHRPSDEMWNRGPFLTKKP